MDSDSSPDLSRRLVLSVSVRVFGVAPGPLSSSFYVIWFLSEVTDNLVKSNRKIPRTPTQDPPDQSEFLVVGNDSGGRESSRGFTGCVFVLSLFGKEEDRGSV